MTLPLFRSAGRPASAGLLLACWLATAVVTFSPNVSAGEEIPGASVPLPPSELRAEQLVDRASLLLRRLAEAEKAFEAETAALAANKEFIDQRRARSAAAQLPSEQPPTEIEGPSLIEKAKAEQEVIEKQAAMLAEQLKIAEEERRALEERSKRLEAARTAAKEVESLTAALQPVVQEIERRVATKDLLPDRVPSALSSSQASERLTRFSEEDQAIQADAKRVQDDLKAIPERIEQARAAVAAAESRRVVAATAYREALKREAIAKELGEKDAATIVALLNAAEGDRQKEAESFAQRRAAFREALAAATAAARAIESEAPPNPEKIPIEAKVARVAMAEKALRLAEALTAFHSRRAELLEQEKAAQILVAEKAAAAAKGATGFDDILLRISVLAERVVALVAEGKRPADSLPRGAEPGAVAAVRAEIAVAPAEFEASAKTAKARVERIPPLIEEALKASKAEGEQLEGLREAYRAASENARFSSAAEGISTPEVIRHFEDALRGLKDGEAGIAANRDLVTRREAAVKEAEARLGAIEDPLLRKVQADNAAKRQEILEKLMRKIAGGSTPGAGEVEPPTPESPKASVGTPSAPTPATASAGSQAAPPAQGASASLTSRNPESVAAAVEARAAVYASRIYVFEERNRERAKLLNAVRDTVGALDLLARSYGDTLEMANRAQGAATVLQARVGQGEISGSVLPEGVTQALDTDRIIKLEGELSEVRESRIAYDDRVRTITQREEEEEEGKREVLSRALSLAGRKMDTIRRRDTLKASLEVDPSTLSEIDAKRIEQEVLARMDKTYSLLESILGLFQSERAEEMEELLKGYYRQVVRLEAKLANLEEQKADTQKLIRLGEEERKIDEEMLPVTRQSLVLLEAEDAAARIRFGLNEPTNSELLAVLEAGGLEPPAREEVLPEEIPAIADRLFDSRMRAIGTGALLRQIEQRLSRLGIDSDIAVYRDEIGAIEASAASTQRDIGRLVGHSREELESVNLADGPSTEADAYRFLEGEIGALRAQRKDVLSRAALISILNLIAIPVFALLLVKIAGKIGKRIVKRVREDGDEHSLEREQRAHTLVQVFKAALTIGVSVIAGIYMLKQFRVDVTPIIASAGVLGLAVAFGAQTLIRDFFAGFFMLLENQYKIGDMIKIGDTGGVVERITLRLTILRDVQGIVHFIPNGTVQQVSNMTKGWSRAVLEIGVAYKEDVNRVMEILREVGDGMKSDPIFGPKLIERPEVPGVEEFGDSAVTIRMMLKTRPAEQWNVAREARRRIKSAFELAGVEIPFPQRVIYHVYPQGHGSGHPAEERQSI